jgi:predicted O-methyltransferase YrrM
MNLTRTLLLQELEQFGADNDRRVTERQGKMLNITPDTGAFLAVLVRATRARRILEVGTSNGYSTLWLADVAEALGGHVTTVERLPAKAALARANFARAGLAGVIELHEDDAGAVLGRLPAAGFDLLFLDSERSRYASWWPDLHRVLAPGGLLVADNAVSHPEEMAPLFEAVAATPGYATVVVPVGKGEFLAVKEANQ